MRNKDQSSDEPSSRARLPSNDGDQGSPPCGTVAEPYGRANLLATPGHAHVSNPIWGVVAGRACNYEAFGYCQGIISRKRSSDQMAAGEQRLL